jgi:hypothetical protein
MTKRDKLESEYAHRLMQPVSREIMDLVAQTSQQVVDRLRKHVQNINPRSKLLQGDKLDHYVAKRFGNCATSLSALIVCCVVQALDEVVHDVPFTTSSELQIAHRLRAQP